MKTVLAIGLLFNPSSGEVENWSTKVSGEWDLEKIASRLAEINCGFFPEQILIVANINNVPAITEDYKNGKDYNEVNT